MRTAMRSFLSLEWMDDPRHLFEAALICVITLAVMQSVSNG